jgi:hypothetical protein
MIGFVVLLVTTVISIEKDLHWMCHEKSTQRNGTSM